MKYNKVIDSYISYCFEPHEVKTTKDRPNSIYWIKGGEIIVEIINSKNFWLNYNIWMSISRMFELSYYDTQSVIKEWLEQHHNLGELTPGPASHLVAPVLEQHHNFGGLTPELALSL